MTQIVKSFLMASFAAVSLSLMGCAEANSAENAPASPAEISAPKLDVVSEAPQWTILADGSHLKFSALQEGESFSGEFTEFYGQIFFDPDNPASGAVSISIPLSSVEAGTKDRNSTLPGKVWFSTKAFPVATFASDEMSKTETGYLAKGALSLKGKTIPFDLPFDLKIIEDQAVMTSRADMDRTLWNVGAAPWDTDEWVSRNVSLDIQVTAKRL